MNKSQVPWNQRMSKDQLVTDFENLCQKNQTHQVWLGTVQQAKYYCRTNPLKTM